MNATLSAPHTLAARIADTAALAAREKLISCYARAFDRAVAAKLVCYHDRTEDTYAVPSASTPGTFYTVRHLGGSDWANLSCSCKAGNHAACLHRAVVAFARKNHISASLPKCPPCDDRFCDGGCPQAPATVDVCSICGQALLVGGPCQDCYPSDWPSNETTEEPPFAEQEQAAGIYDAGHTPHNGTRLFVAADPFAGYLPL